MKLTCYSARSATIGLTAAARHAGTMVATTAIIATVMATPTNVAGSAGDTP
jgi:hypothetical protein